MDRKNILGFMWSPILMKLELSINFLKHSNIKFHENPFSGSRVVPCRRTDGRVGGRTDRRTHMAKLIVTFRNFANAPQHDYCWEAGKDLKVMDRLVSQRSSGGTEEKHESPNQHSRKHSCESKPILREVSLPHRNRYALTDDGHYKVPRAKGNR
jgi:hypothetical protein